jgi:hypothetical protein
MTDGIEALQRLADELGVSPKTVAQYADAAGSYTMRQSHETSHKRTLPPRGSLAGIELAERIRAECGTDRVRTLAVAIARQTTT